jgi:integrase
VNAVAASLVLGDGQTFPVSLDKDSLFSLILKSAPDGELPTAVIGEGGICTIMSDAIETVVVGGIEVQIYHGSYPYPYPDGALADHYRYPANVRDEETGEIVSRLRLVMHSLAKARAAATAEATAQADERDRLAKLPPDQSAGITSIAQYVCDELTGIGVEFYSAMTQLLGAAKARKKSWPENAPGFDRIVEEAGLFAEGLRPSKPWLLREVTPGFIAESAALLADDDIAQSTDKKNRSVATRLANDPRLGNRYIHTIQQKELVDWLVKFGRSTALGYLSSLVMLFRFAREEGALPRGDTAADGIKLTKRMFKKTRKLDSNGVEEQGKIAFYSAADALKIIVTAYWNKQWHPWIPAIALRLFGGFHFSEIFRMRFDHLRSDAIPRAVVKRDVTGTHHKPRTVFFSSANWSLLAPFYRLARWKKRLHYPIVPTMPVGKPKNAHYDTYKDQFDSIFAAIAAAAGITVKSNGLRHSFATHLAHLTCYLVYVARQMGSHLRHMLIHYVEVDVKPDDPQKYFQIGHPRKGSFVSQPNWIAPEFYRTRKEAFDEAARLEAEEQEDPLAFRRRY